MSTVKEAFSSPCYLRIPVPRPSKEPYGKTVCCEHCFCRVFIDVIVANPIYTVHRLFDQRVLYGKGRAKIPPNLTFKPKAMATANLACALVFTKL